MEISISFIIPTYNNGLLLERCLNSIINQVENCDEIIVVDDGSEDKTEEIIRDICLSESKIKYIKQMNSGSGAARNNGINLANNNYIWFVDSDDYLESNAVNLIKRELSMNPIDILFIGYKQLCSNNVINSIPNYTNTKEMMLAHHFPWNKIFKKTLFQSIRFPTEKIRYQDHGTIPRAILNAETFGYVSELLYVYDFTHDSNISKDKKKEEHIFIATEYLIRNLKDTHEKELEYLLIATYLFNYLFNDMSVFKRIQRCKKVVKILNENVPNWKKSSLLKFNRAKDVSHLIPYVKIKIIIAKFMSASFVISSFLISIINIAKKTRNKL
ncbi:glycosyltransferase [Bacillus sp. JCM 19046]|nr:glycosyltransferase [Bacillus sp. JCM 19045]GAF19997.1 glycosyltransferase [Bacillus sp. JCM 19046]